MRFSPTSIPPRTLARTDSPAAISGGSRYLSVRVPSMRNRTRTNSRHGSRWTSLAFSETAACRILRMAISALAARSISIISPFRRKSPRPVSRRKPFFLHLHNAHDIRSRRFPPVYFPLPDPCRDDTKAVLPKIFPLSKRQRTDSADNFRPSHGSSRDSRSPSISIA